MPSAAASAPDLLAVAARHEAAQVEAAAAAGPLSSPRDGLAPATPAAAHRHAHHMSVEVHGSTATSDPLGALLGPASPLSPTSPRSGHRLPANGDGSSGAKPAAAVPPRGSLELSDHSVSLKGGEKTVVTLRVRPLAAGCFRIQGVEWLLGGVARGRVDFVPVETGHRRQQNSAARNTLFKAGCRSDGGRC